MSQFEVDISKVSSDKVVLFDVDGVLLELWTPMYLYWKKEMRAKGEHPGLRRFSLEEIYGYYKDPSCSSGIGDRFGQQEAFGKLRPKEEMVETVHALKKMGYDLVVITAASNDPLTRAKRCKNLMEVFGDVFNQIHCVGSASKEGLIRTYAGLYKESAFCDDHPGNVQKSVGVVTYPIWRFNQPLVPLLEKLDTQKASVIYKGGDLLEILQKPVRQVHRCPRSKLSFLMPQLMEKDSLVM